MTPHAATTVEGTRGSDHALVDTRGWSRALLVCGVASSVHYAVMTAYVTLQAEGYRSMSQAVSELSAIDAPTRPLWVALGVPYTMLVLAFGFGVWMSARGSRALRAAGALFVAQALLSATWPPMHLRGVEPTLTDRLHAAWAGGWLVSMLVVMGLAAAVLGRRFRVYTLVTVAVFVVFGFLTTLEAPRLEAGLPTPYLGLWERVNMGAGMLWTAVLAGTLLRRAERVGEWPDELRRPRPASSS